MTNPSCYTPKCASCPVKDSCSNYQPSIPYAPYEPPYRVGDFPWWSNDSTETDDTIYSSMKLVVY